MVMTSPLLQTKLYIPATRSELVARPRLLTCLNEGVCQPIRMILVAAPAGFGKTTLVSSWVHQLGAERDDLPHVAWVSLDKDDSAPLQFLNYVIAALRTAQPKVGKLTLAAAQSSSPPPLDVLVINLINELASLSQSIVLVLDDYHTINNADVHQMVNFLIENLPPTLHLVISTREDPPLGLSRLRVRQQLVEIRATDLRFTEREAATFLNELMHLDLVEGDIAALESRTEGWIAGLQLAALFLQNTADKSEFVQAFAGSHRFLTDYLVDEVLSKQTPIVRQFLRRTSILGRFCAEVCDVLVESNDSRQILRQLEQANLFLIPLDDARRWFRYHHLFAEFLRLRLYESEPDAVPELYRRAIDWFARSDLDREALQYALKAQEYERAADLIERLAPEILERDDHMLVVRWAEALPPALVKQRAYLCVYLGWAWVVAAQIETAESWLVAAASLCDQMGQDHAGVIRAHVDAHRAYIAFMQGDYMRAIDRAQSALDGLPDADIALRARTITCLGNAYNYAGRLDEATEVFYQAIDIAKEIGSLSLAMFSYGSLGEVFRDRGWLTDAFDVYHQLLEFSETLTGEPDSPWTGYAQFEIGAIWREWNDLDRAIGYLKNGVDLCRTWRQGEALAIGLMELAETHRLRGEYAEAEAAIDEARQLAAAISPWASRLVDSFAIRVALSRGDLVAVERWVEQSGLEDGGMGYERFPEYLPLIRFYIATGKFEQALTVTERLLERDRALGRLGRVLDVLVLRFVALDAAGHADQALDVLDEAVTIAAPHKHVRSFVEHMVVLEPYLQKMPASPHRDCLLAIASDDVASDPVSVPESPEALNEREIQVLRLMSAGLSNREIGNELFLSVNTIRWYASQIYSKLNVKRRGEAVARAREMGVL